MSYAACDGPRVGEALTGLGSIGISAARASRGTYSSIVVVIRCMYRIVYIVVVIVIVIVIVVLFVLFVSFLVSF